MYFHTSTRAKWTSYTEPFTIGVWLSIIGWIAIAAVLMHIIAFSFGKFDKNENRNFGDSVFDVAKAIFSQGGKLQIQKTSFYITYLMPYLLAVILLQYYSGKLLSYLTVKNPEPPFKNLEGLVKTKSYKISLLQHTYPLFFFKVSIGTFC